MHTIETIALIVHTFIAVLIIALVLLQRGKGADAGAAFGSGASGTVFGARGSSSFFSRATAILATAFFVSSLLLAYISSQEADMPDSLIESAPQPTTPAPADDDGVASGAPAETTDTPTTDTESGTPAEATGTSATDTPATDTPPKDSGLPELPPAEPADEPPQDDEPPR